MKKILPLLILAALAFLAWKFFLKGGGTGSGGSAIPSVVTPADAVSAAKGIFKEATSTFASIKDVPSANAAVPRLENINKAASDLVAMKGQLPAALKEGLVSATKDYAPKFQEMVKKAYAIPGVQAIIEPKINQLGRTFESFVQ